MIENELISIIVPVYNVEKYLDRCLNSIVQQTYTNLEIILVDDGSTDKSGEICDIWKQKDDRIVVIHKENGGLSSARNAGLELSTGKYIGFVDSDDWITNNMYELLFCAIKRNNSNLALSNYIIVKNYTESIKQPNYAEKIMDKNELYKLYFRVTDYDIHYCSWDKLYARELIGDYRFTEGIFFEDLDFIFKILPECNKTVYINQYTYYWFYNKGSISRNSLRKRDRDIIPIWNNIYNICKKEYPQYEYYAYMNYLRAHMGIIAKACRFGVSEEYQNWEIDQKSCLMVLRHNFKKLVKWHMRLSRKILLCIICFSPKLVTNFFKIYKKE